jgi:Uncharacterised protein family (UPF0236)
VAQELERLLGRLLRPAGGLDLEASELAIRAAMHEVGGVLLAKLLNRDPGGSQAAVKCAAGHAATFVDYRRKGITTVVGPVEFRRAYYHCDECGEGVLPQDEALDLVGTSFSPGVRRLMGRVGGKESFNEGRMDLEELAGIKVQTKAVERVAEGIGAELEALGQSERQRVINNQKVVPLKSILKLYVSFDGTGVPVIKRETCGRRGKSATGEAHTREAKLGCVFTQTAVDKKGRPVRDEAATTYVGAIEAAAEFGWRIYGEAERRGLRRAAQVIVIGDGAPWVWGIAAEHFPGAIEIVDLYHAREHLADLSKLVYGVASAKAKQWTTARLVQLDEGDVESLLLSLRRLRPTAAQTKEAVRQTIGYFEGNRQRMRYAQFRRQELFVGSGVIEAGCKTIVGRRLKQSGMRWSLRGANAIIALRCAQLSGRWEEFWEMRAAG